MTTRPIRDYQDEAVSKSLHELLECDRPSTLVVMPTGTGKNTVAANVVKRWPRDRGRIMFLAHRDRLLQQSAETIRDVAGEFPVWEAGELRLPRSAFLSDDERVVMASKDSLHPERLSKFDPRDFGLVIVDEAHRGAAKNLTYGRVYKHFAQNPRAKLLGLTATPGRGDKVALVGEGRAFESVAYQYRLWDGEGGRSALTDGWLVPPRQGFPVIEGLKLADIQTPSGDFTEQQIEKVFSEEKVLHEVALGLQSHAGERPTIVFCSTIAHAAGVHDVPPAERKYGQADVLNRYKKDSARSIHGKMSKDEQNHTLAAFRAGDIQYLVSCDLLIEGLDETRVGCVAICRPTKFWGRYAQMVGRGLRPLGAVVKALNAAPDAAARRAVIAASAKPDCLVLDFVGLGDLSLTVSLADILADATEDCPAVRLAKQKAKEAKGGKDMAEALQEAKAELWEKATTELLAEIKAKGSSSILWQDPLGGGVQPTKANGAAPKTPATPKQIALLLGLGIPEVTSRDYSRGQAGVVIDRLTAQRCTASQAKVLSKYGYDPKAFNMDAASAKIDAIASAGWQRVD